MYTEHCVQGMLFCFSGSCQWFVSNQVVFLFFSHCGTQPVRICATESVVTSLIVGIALGMWKIWNVSLMFRHFLVWAQRVDVREDCSACPAHARAAVCLRSWNEDEWIGQCSKTLRNRWFRKPLARHQFKDTEMSMPQETQQWTV